MTWSSAFFMITEAGMLAKIYNDQWMIERVS
jgi:hypothetical protein